MQQVDKENLLLFARKVKTMRLKKSKSLNNFVFNSDYLTTATWSRIQNGKFDLKLSTLLRVSQMLGVTVDKLLKDVDFNYNFNEE